MFLYKVRLFSLFGFEVSVDASWLLLAALIAWSLAEAVFPGLDPHRDATTYWTMGILATIGLMFSIVFHEMSHSLVARHYGMPIRGITLFIFGGVAEMTNEPSHPRDELLMAAAGPAASLLLAALVYLLYAVVLVLHGPSTVAAVCWYLALLNGVLAVFNLVPAFPLDGGRMFRAALWWWRGDPDWATRIAANAGSMFGTLLIVLGLLGVLEGDFVGGMWRFLIGMFLRGAASASYGDTLARRLLSAIPVARIMSPKPIVVPAAISVQDFIEDYVYSRHHRWFPISDDGTVIGTVTTQQAAAVDRALWPTMSVMQIMRSLTAEDVVDPGTDAFKALGLMRGSGRSRLLVMHNGVLVGILSSRDLVDALSLEQELHAGKLMNRRVAVQRH
jgi:Zn-dependent protease